MTGRVNRPLVPIAPGHRSQDHGLVTGSHPRSANSGWFQNGIRQSLLLLADEVGSSSACLKTCSQEN